MGRRLERGEEMKREGRREVGDVEERREGRGLRRGGEGWGVEDIEETREGSRSGR